MKTSRFKKIQKLAPQVAENIRNELAGIPMSRADRRALKRAEKHKAPSHSTTKAFNTIDMAKTRAATLTPEKQKLWMGAIHRAFESLKKAERDASAFNCMADALNVAMALTLPEVARLLPDHAEKFEAGLDAMNDLAQRILHKKTWTMYPAEITALETAIEFHGYQVQFASAGEMVKAQDHVANVARGVADRMIVKID